MLQSQRTLTVIVPIHNEQENLPELQRQLKCLMDGMPSIRTDVLLVSDGSTDRSEEMIAEICRDDVRFQGIYLTRNFGHQAAVSVGLEHSTGSMVSIIDGDLQDPPAVIPRMIEALDDGADVAYGVRRNRKEGFLKRTAYLSFYRILRAVADIEIPLDSGDFCCMRRNVVDAMRALPERNRFVRGLRAWVGYHHVGVEYDRAARHAGTPSYSWLKLVQLAYDGLFSFSALPIRVIQMLGFFISFCSLGVAALYLVLYCLRPAIFPQGFATITISIWFIAGLQLFVLGVLGEYVVRSFDEIRRRPTALVREVVGSSRKDDTLETIETTLQDLRQLVSDSRELSTSAR